MRAVILLLGLQWTVERGIPQGLVSCWKQHEKVLNDNI